MRKGTSLGTKKLPRNTIRSFFLNIPPLNEPVEYLHNIEQIIGVKCKSKDIKPRFIDTCLDLGFFINHMVRSN